jgi:hypothetical protein
LGRLASAASTGAAAIKTNATIKVAHSARMAVAEGRFIDLLL